MDPKSGFVEVNGAQLYYERAGAGPALLMIHAGIADCRMWDHEFASLADSYQTVRFDMRGYVAACRRPASSIFRMTWKACWAP